MAWDVGSMAGASAFGYLSSAVGYGPAFAISAVLLPIAAAGVFLMREPAPAVADPAPAKAG